MALALPPKLLGSVFTSDSHRHTIHVKKSLRLDFYGGNDWLMGGWVARCGDFCEKAGVSESDGGGSDSYSTSILLLCPTVKRAADKASCSSLDSVASLS